MLERKCDIIKEKGLKIVILGNCTEFNSLKIPNISLYLQNNTYNIT